MRNKRHILMICILVMSISILSACGKSTDQADTTESAVSVSADSISDSKESADSMTPEINAIFDSDSEEEAFDFEWPYPNVTPWTWEECQKYMS